MPDRDWVEDEVGLSARAEINAAVFAVARAVVPEVDLIHIPDLILLVGLNQRLRKRWSLEVVHARCGEVGEVGFHEVIAAQRALAPSCDLYKDQTNEGGNGQGPRDRNARDSTCLPHGCCICAWRVRMRVVALLVRLVGIWIN